MRPTAILVSVMLQRWCERRQLTGGESAAVSSAVWRHCGHCGDTTTESGGMSDQRRHLSSVNWMKEQAWAVLPQVNHS